MIDRPLPDFARLHAYEALGSTNDEAKRLAEAGAPAWTVVSAGIQTAGRGRRQRSWVSPAGNLHMSAILRPSVPIAIAPQLGFAAALAVGDAVAALLPSARLLQFKWPNDVMISGRKVAGVLLESSATESGSALWVVVGIGVNVLHFPSEAATSLVAEAVRDPSPARLLSDIVTALHRRAGEWEHSGFETLRRAWLARARDLGAEIVVRLEREHFAGRFIDLDGDGALLVETALGRRRVTAGEIFPVAA